MIRRLLDLLLGGHCSLGCGHRVYPKDVTRHYLTEHAGDR